MTQHLLYSGICFLLGGFLLPRALDTQVKLGFRLGLLITALVVWFMGLYSVPYPILVQMLKYLNLPHEMIPIVAVVVAGICGGIIAFAGYRGAPWIEALAARRLDSRRKSMERLQNLRRFE